MVRYKYTPELLAEAAARARSVTDVLRLLGVRVSGGSHAHISRQLKRFGIDTSHFTGQGHSKGRPGARRAPSEILVKLAPDARRTPGFRLRRALALIGVPEKCDNCGLGPVWQGAPLVLHVDHINGDHLDNRPLNLRLLCPNCHSQTATYAGRARSSESNVGHNQQPNRPVSAEAGNRSEPSGVPTGFDEILSLVQRVSAGDLTSVEAARRIGCTRDHVSRMRRRLESTGSILPQPLVRDRPIQRQFRESVLRFALDHPQFGSRKIARGLAEASGGVSVISHRTVQLILREAGLSNPKERRSRLSKSAGVA